MLDSASVCDLIVFNVIETLNMRVTVQDVTEVGIKIKKYTALN